MSPISTIANGSPVRVTEALNPTLDRPVYVLARDETITQQKADGRAWFLVVACENQAQADHVAEQMPKRQDLGAPMFSAAPMVANEHSAPHQIPFRLLGRRWLEGWQETADRIEVREGPSGSLYIALVTDGATVGEERIPANRDDKEERLAAFRLNYPAHALFDYR